MAKGPTLISQIIAIVKDVVGILAKLLSGAGSRRMRTAIEAAEKYIQVNEKVGEFTNISKQRRHKLLKHYRKRFFAYNN